MNFFRNINLVLLFDTFYICLIDWKIKDFDRYVNHKTDFSYLNKLSDDFKEMLYELIVFKIFPEN